MLELGRHLVWEESCYGEKQFAGSVPFDSLLREQGMVHSIGQGIIGQAAFSGTPLWINRDAFFNHGIKGFTELNHQFAAGIRTVVVIPVLPHGVLQLGSTLTVIENTPFVILVKSLFSQLDCRPIASVPDSTQTTQIHMESPMGCTPTLPSNSLENLPKEEILQHGSELFDMVGASKVNESRSNFGNNDQNCSESMATFGLAEEEQACQSGIFSDSGTDQLLDAVVSNMNNNGKKSTGTGTGSGGNTNGEAGSCSHSSEKSELQLWIEGTGSGGTRNKKRCIRAGENKPRPRPKDRQLIQDRIKDLRDLVPNAAKCSIDALLEKTIKHMLFLQTVSKHAHKLKYSASPKEQQLVSEEGGVVLKDDFEGGATWAFEVGAQSMSCPIIVEDLDPPHQLLIEMVCEDRGIFLEIADLIKGLGLTILKGVMEARKNRVWAHFAVEANRKVTRMEIFLSLVHLLDPTGNGADNTSLPNQTGLLFPTTAVPEP